MAEKIKKQCKILYSESKISKGKSNVKPSLRQNPNHLALHVGIIYLDSRPFGNDYETSYRYC